MSVTTAERKATRKQLHKFISTLPESIYLDVSNMTHEGEGIVLISGEKAKKQGKCGVWGWFELYRFGMTIYPFVSDNYENYVRAIVCYCDKDVDFVAQYAEQLEEIRSLGPPWKY